MSVFERYLTLWVAICIVVGVAAGHFLPSLFHAIGGLELAKVNLPMAALIWLMIIPMLVRIDFASLRQVGGTGAASASRFSSTGRSSRSP